MISATRENPFLLAADKPERLLEVLRDDPGLAPMQDEYGYSLLHAAVSYNHVELVRALVADFHVNVNLRDQDEETALFLAESVDCAKVLVEELQADTTLRGLEGKTAREKISLEEEFPEVAVYLMIHEFGGSAEGVSVESGKQSSIANIIGPAPRLPDGLAIDMSTMSPEDVDAEAVDPDFRQRIEELAARPDFQGEEGQEELRNLITEALREQITEGRDVKPRLD